MTCFSRFSAAITLLLVVAACAPTPGQGPATQAEVEALRAEVARLKEEQLRKELEAEIRQEMEAKQRQEADAEEAQRQAELERQQEAQRQAELERQQEAQRQAELERQQEAQRQAELERQQEAQRQAELERQQEAQRQAEQEQQASLQQDGQQQTAPAEESLDVAEGELGEVLGLLENVRREVSPLRLSPAATADLSRQLQEIEPKIEQLSTDAADIRIALAQVGDQDGAEIQEISKRIGKLRERADSLNVDVRNMTRKFNEERAIVAAFAQWPGLSSSGFGDPELASYHSRIQTELQLLMQSEVR